MTATKSSAHSGGKQIGAIKLLKDDHKQVKAWFAEYEDLDSDAKKQALADKICTALLVHTQIEEEIFYPATREATDDNDLMDEAVVEHAGAKHLIAEIQGMKAGDPLFDAKVKVLGEQIAHHVEEEESEMFPESRDTDLDMKELGAEMAARKEELLKKSA